MRIGRNVGTVPMDDERWESFIGQARAVLDGVAAGLDRGRVEPFTQWTEVHIGQGTWTADDGSVVVEQSAVVSLFTSSSLLDRLGTDRMLVDAAAELAAEFEQDAVAVVTGGVSLLVDAAAVVR